MSVARALTKLRYGPVLLGIGSAILVLVFVQWAVKAGWINQFAVPPPLDVIEAFPRLVNEEDVLARFGDTAFEAITR